jgi:hypothetical protein
VPSIGDIFRAAYQAEPSDGTANKAGEINGLLAKASADANSATRGLVVIPQGIYRIDEPVDVPSNVDLMCFGVLRLGANQNGDVVRLRNVSNVRLWGLKVDGNRANNLLGTRYGVWLYNVTDSLLEDVDVYSARADGIRLDQCERVELRGCKGHDNGRHGVSLSYCQFLQLSAVRAYDNCRVEAVGTADGIHLELLSGDNIIIGAAAYETGLAGDRQGYGIAEAVSELCYRNTIVGGSLQGNRTGALSLESTDSMAFVPALVQYQTASLHAT